MEELRENTGLLSRLIGYSFRLLTTIRSYCTTAGWVYRFLYLIKAAAILLQFENKTVDFTDI